VRELHALCHPDYERPPYFFLAHPTLVKIVDGRVIGFTSFSVAPAPACPHLLEAGELMYGHGLAILPTYQNLGYGTALVEARRQIGLALGVEVFIGMTEPDNVGMLRIFERQGLKAYETRPSAYPNGAAGVVYVGGLQ